MKIQQISTANNLAKFPKAGNFGMSKPVSSVNYSANSTDFNPNFAPAALANAAITKQISFKGKLEDEFVQEVNNGCDWNKIEEIITNPDFDVNHRFRHREVENCTPLFAFTYRNKPDLIRLLAENERLLPNVPSGGSNWTPLMLACWNNNQEDEISALLEIEGLDTTLKDSHGRTAYALADNSNNTNTYRRLINARDKILEEGRAKRLGRVLIKAGVTEDNIYSLDSLEKVLEVASGNQKALTHPLTATGETFAHILSEIPVTPENQARYQALLDALAGAKGVNWDARDSSKRTPILKAVVAEHVPLIEFLKKQGVNYTLMNGKGDTVFSLARTIKTPEVLAALKDFRFLQAVEDGTMTLIDTLLHNPAVNVNAIDKDGRTALHTACNRGDVDLVRMLMNHAKIDVNAVTKSGNSAGIIAADINSPDILELLAKKTDFNPNYVNSRNGNPHTMLTKATSGGFLDKAFTLLPGIDVNVVEPNSGESLGIMAAKADNKALLGKLAEAKGFNPNYVNPKTGETMLVCASSNDALTAMLKTAGIDVKLGKNGSPALFDFAQKHVDLFRILAEHPETDIEAEFGGKNISDYIASLNQQSPQSAQSYLNIVKSRKDRNVTAQIRSLLGVEGYFSLDAIERILGYPNIRAIINTPLSDEGDRLVHYFADVSERDEDSMVRMQDCLRNLENASPDLNLENTAGKTALDRAVQAENPLLCEWLIKHKAKCQSETLTSLRNAKGAMELVASIARKARMLK